MKKRTRVIKVGKIKIGGKNPIAVQSMTKTKTHRVRKTVSEIKRLEKAGCELIRCAVVNSRDANALSDIKKSISISLVADIHFDYRLALKAIDAGVDKVRINPGTIGASWKLREVIKKAGDNDIPIRIGVNSGSLPKSIMRRYRHPTPKAVVATVKEAVDFFEKHNFNKIILSAKGVFVTETIEVNQALHDRFDYPLHLGITEAGLPFRGGIKSAIGIGILLHEGIGDTIRVSLTGDPVYEVVAAYEILGALGLRQHNAILISCPTCGRCEVDLVKIAKIVERKLSDYNNAIKVAVMGCVVNGPGEAREADFGIACGKNSGVVFAKGEPIKRVKESKLVDSLFEVIDENLNN